MTDIAHKNKIAAAEAAALHFLLALVTENKEARIRALDGLDGEQLTIAYMYTAARFRDVLIDQLGQQGAAEGLVRTMIRDHENGETRD